MLSVVLFLLTINIVNGDFCGYWCLERTEVELKNFLHFCSIEMGDLCFHQYSVVQSKDAFLG